MEALHGRYSQCEGEDGMASRHPLGSAQHKRCRASTRSVLAVRGRGWDGQWAFHWAVPSSRCCVQWQHPQCGNTEQMAQGHRIGSAGGQEGWRHSVHPSATGILAVQIRSEQTLVATRTSSVAFTDNRDHRMSG
eukprot:jgi/Ulvmu1/2857/UM145_0012.1